MQSEDRKRREDEIKRINEAAKDGLLTKEEHEDQLKSAGAARIAGASSSAASEELAVDVSLTAQSLKQQQKLQQQQQQQKSAAPVQQQQQQTPLEHLSEEIGASLTFWMNNKFLSSISFLLPIAGVNAMVFAIVAIIITSVDPQRLMAHSVSASTDCTDTVFSFSFLFLTCSLQFLLITSSLSCSADSICCCSARLQIPNVFIPAIVLFALLTLALLVCVVACVPDRDSHKHKGSFRLAVASFLFIDLSLLVQVLLQLYADGEHFLFLFRICQAVGWVLLLASLCFYPVFHAVKRARAAATAASARKYTAALRLASSAPGPISIPSNSTTFHQQQVGGIPPSQIKIQVGSPSFCLGL